MIRHLIFCAGLAATSVASARLEDLADEGGISPNKRYSISVEADSPQATIYYVIRDRHNAGVLGRFRSTYQREPGDDSDFAWEQSHPSWIYWRGDSHYVAIDEANHRHIGTVILAQRVKASFRQIPLHEDKLIESTKKPWSRVRLFFGDNSFLPHDRAAIAVVGEVRFPQTEHYEDSGCEIVIDLRHNGKILKAVIPPKMKSPNHAMQRTAGRSAFQLSMTSILNRQRRALSPAVADLGSR